MRQLLIFIIFTTVGTLILMNTEPIVNTTGRVGWAERHLGGAGTFALYKIIGVIIIVIGMLVATGLFDLAFGGIIRFLFGGGAKDSTVVE